MTREQAIVLGAFAAAFLTGWVAHALTAAAGRRRLGSAVPGGATLGAGRFELAVNESRRELDRAIRAYHATVALSLEEHDPDVSDEASLEVLARALVALALAVDHTSQQLELGHPLSATLYESGSHLRQLAEDVMLHSAQPHLPTPVFDQLEQHLMSAAAVILAPGRVQVHAS
jgi:hypothetical protein